MIAEQLWALAGNRQRLDGGAMFGNAPRSLWSKWAPPDEQNRIDLACRCLLARFDARWFLFETGIGAFFPPEMKARYGVVEPEHRVLEALGELGLTHEDISVVVLSHLHFDHAGGLLSRHDDGAKLLFPNARFVVSDSAWERANHPHPRDRASFVPDLNVQLAESGRLDVLQRGETYRDAPFLRFHDADGHTPGLLCAELDADDGPVVFASDLIPGSAWINAAITMGYDRFPERLIDEKRALLAALVARNGRVFFTHDPELALARVTQDADGRFRSTDGVRHAGGAMQLR